jgi:hypothetical protein
MFVISNPSNEFVANVLEREQRIDALITCAR